MSKTRKSALARANKNRPAWSRIIHIGRITKEQQSVRDHRATRLLDLGRGPKPSLAAGMYRQLLEDLRVQRNKRKAMRRAAHA